MRLLQARRPFLRLEANSITQCLKETGTASRADSRALESGPEAGAILNDCLMPAINRVGELFDCGRYFLPQLISGAEAMKLSIGVLEPYLLQDENREQLPVVVLATVKGDIHDIGKNLVALMMKNYGFQVIDLGKDVPARTSSARPRKTTRP